MISRLFDDTELISDIIFAFLYYYITKSCIFKKKYEKTKGMLIIIDLTYDSRTEHNHAMTTISKFMLATCKSS